MNTPTLDEQFLQNLSQEQKGRIWDYYRVITNPDIAPNMVVERIASIWNEAAQDPKLLSWLELVDYFYTDVDESECFNENERAYLSEYLAPKAGLPTNLEELDERSREGQNSTPRSHLFLLECPDESGYIFFSEEEIESLERKNALETRRCSQCHRTLSEHRIARKSPLPDS